MIQSIQRAVTIMRAFTESEPELGVIELSRRLGLHKSTVSRILTTLQAEGLVQQNPDTGKYSLAVGLVSLAGVALGQLSVRGAALPHMEQLAARTQETVSLTALEGGDGVCIAEIPGPQPVRYVVWLGRRIPLNCTASGKVLLAYTPAAERDRLLSFPLVRYTSKTKTDFNEITPMLAEVAQQGYAVEQDEFVEGITAIAAPIVNHAQKVVAALSMAGPAFRIGPEELALFTPQLLEAGGAISAQLGYGGSYPKLLPVK